VNLKRRGNWHHIHTRLQLTPPVLLGDVPSCDHHYYGQTKPSLFLGTQQTRKFPFTLNEEVSLLILFTMASSELSAAATGIRCLRLPLLFVILFACERTITVTSQAADHVIGSVGGVNIEGGLLPRWRYERRRAATGDVLYRPSSFRLIDSDYRLDLSRTRRSRRGFSSADEDEIVSRLNDVRRTVPASNMQYVVSVPTCTPYLYYTVVTFLHISMYLGNLNY